MFFFWKFTMTSLFRVFLQTLILKLVDTNSRKVFNRSCSNYADFFHITLSSDWRKNFMVQVLPINGIFVQNSVENSNFNFIFSLVQERAIACTNWKFLVFYVLMSPSWVITSRAPIFIGHRNWGSDGLIFKKF